MGGEPPRSGDVSQELAQPGHVELRSPHAHAPVGARTDALCAVWGVLNVTPDSFSDGGRHLALEDALAHADRMLSEGADVIDVGGESSRPPGHTYGAGAETVAIEEELARVVPVVERLATRGAVVSVDTVKAAVAREAMAAGAQIVNDVSGGASEPLLDVVAAAGAHLVLMHTRDGGRVAADSTRYRDVVNDVLRELMDAVAKAEGRGIARHRIWIDPGIGFAKTAAQSASLLGNLDAFVRTRYPVLVGASRKSFIARTMTEAGGHPPPPGRRLGGSLAAVVTAALAGCAAVRVHDVGDSVQAARVSGAIRATRRGEA